MYGWKVSFPGFIETMAKKFHSVRDVVDSGLCLIDFEFHASFDEPSDALQRPLGRSIRSIFRTLIPVSGLPRASFRFRLATDTLAFGYALGATSCARDLHPLDHAHAGRTKANAGNPWYGFLRPLRGSVAALDHGWLSPLRHQHPAESIVRNKFFARRSDFSFF